MEEVWTAIRAAEEATILRVHHPEELLAIAETYGRDRGAIPTPYPGGVVPPAPSTVVRRRSGGSFLQRDCSSGDEVAGRDKFGRSRHEVCGFDDVEWVEGVGAGYGEVWAAAEASADCYPVGPHYRIHP